MFEMLRAKSGSLMVSGHRGAMGYAPENTMPSFEKALQCGCDIIEFDVHLSRDRQCVIIHDFELERTTDGHGVVIDYTVQELKKLDAGSWFDRRVNERREANAQAEHPLPLPETSFTGARIPLLDEVLEWAKASKMAVSVELKSPLPFYYSPEIYHDLVEKVLDALARYGLEETAALHSFDHRMVKRVKELNPNLATTISLGGAVFADPVAVVQAALANGVAVPAIFTDQPLIELFHANDINVFAWGFGEDPYAQATEICKLVKMGVDIVSGGFPDLLRDVVEKCL